MSCLLLMGLASGGMSQTKEGFRKWNETERVVVVEVVVHLTMRLGKQQVAEEGLPPEVSGHYLGILKQVSTSTIMTSA